MIWKMDYISKPLSVIDMILIFSFIKDAKYEYYDEDFEQDYCLN